MDRVKTIYRPVVIEVGDFSGFCLVRNISAGGLLGMMYADFAPDLPVTVDFSDRLKVDGKVVWSRDGRIGVSFSTEIDVQAVLRDLGSKIIDDQVNRAPRLAIEHPVTIEWEDRTEQTVLHNISQRGVKVSTQSLVPADEVFVHLEGMETRKALVRWTDNGMAGLNFVRPLEFDRLANWVIGFQARCWAERGRRV